MIPNYPPSTKSRLAPLFYLLIHFVLVYGLCVTCPNFNSFHEHKYLILFWISAAISIILFFVVHKMDPGYVPNDVVFFTEEEPPMGVSQNHKQYDSMMKLRVADSRFLSKGGFDFSPSAVEAEAKKNVLFMNKNFIDKSKFLKSTLGSTSITKPGTNTLSSPKVDKTRDIDLELGQSRYIEGDEHDQTRAEGVLSKEFDANNEVLDCQITSNCDDDRPNYELRNEEPPEMKRNPQFSPNNFSPNNMKFKMKINPPTKMNEYKVKYGLQLDDVTEEQEADVANGDMKISEQSGVDTFHSHLRSTPAGHQEGNQADQENRHSSKDLEAIREVEPTDMDDDKNMSVMMREMDMQGDNSVIYAEAQNTALEKGGKLVLGKAFELSQINDPCPTPNKFELSVVEAFMNNTSKLGQTNRPRTLDLDVRRSGDSVEPKGIKEGDVQTPGDTAQLELLYVERRYCTICNIEQPLRSKHCRDCNKCIGQYDHHCPWLGTCIGEKNHMPFYFFIVFQFIEIAWGEFTLLQNVMNKPTSHGWIGSDVGRMLVLAFTTFLFMMVGSLLFFHSFLATQNMTTWEFLSWNKISYLKDWHPKWGSPFYMGFLKNIHLFCQIKRGLSKWKMPKFKAPLHKQNPIAN